MPERLPSWADTPTRDAILAFIDRVSSGPDQVPEAERVAVFDNDGTLWTEKPMRRSCTTSSSNGSGRPRPTRRSPSASRTGPP